MKDFIQILAMPLISINLRTNGNNNGTLRIPLGVVIVAVPCLLIWLLA